MSKDKILIMDSDESRRNAIEKYLTEQGYDVTSVPDGVSGLKAVKAAIFSVLLIELTLPDIDGCEVARKLYVTPRISYIPIIFLTDWTERRDKLYDYERGYITDYITSPFDLEELKLRIQGAIGYVRRLRDIDPISYRPKAESVVEHLQQLKERDSSWVYFNIVIQNFEAYCDVYGTQYGDDVIRALSLILALVMDDVGTDNDFIGHLQRDKFVVITHTGDVTIFKQSLLDRFDKEIRQHYSFIDRERGYIKDGDKRFPLMSLAITEIPHTYFGEQWDGTLPKQGN